MFLSEDDYKGVCDDFEMEAIEANTDLRLTSERAAQEMVCSYTRGRYDMARAYAATGDDRNVMLVQCTVNIVLWLMIHRLPESMGHERRECLYNDTIKWLKAVQDGKASPDFPYYSSDDGTDTDTHNPIRFGGDKPVVFGGY
jgi:hypothetical protein